METQLALITAEHALTGGSGEKDGSNRTGIEDEDLFRLGRANPGG